MKVTAFGGRETFCQWGWKNHSGESRLVYLPEDAGHVSADLDKAEARAAPPGGHAPPPSS